MGTQAAGREQARFAFLQIATMFTDNPLRRGVGETYQLVGTLTIGMTSSHRTATHGSAWRGTMCRGTSVRGGPLLGSITLGVGLASNEIQHRDVKPPLRHNSNDIDTTIPARRCGVRKRCTKYTTLQSPSTTGSGTQRQRKRDNQRRSLGFITSGNRRASSLK